MRVALFACGFNDYSLHLANALSHYAQTLVIFPQDLSTDYRRLMDSSVSVLYQPPARLYNPKNLFLTANIIKELHKYEPDVVHLQGGNPWLLFWLPRLRARYALVTTTHDVRPHKGEFRLHRRVTSYLTSIAAHCLIVHGEVPRGIAIKKYHMSPERVHSLPIGVHSLYRNWAREDVPEEKDTILFFGRIIKYKGLDYLIEAEPLISERVPGVKIIIAGAGDDFAPYERKMKNRQRFEVHNYRIPPQETAELFQRASLVALPYIDGTQSAVVPIAYAFKKPVVVTRVGSIPEAVPDGVTGFVVPPGDVPGLAEAIIRLLLDEELRRRMGGEAWHFANTQLSWDSIARRTLGIYEEAIRAKKRSA